MITDRMSDRLLAAWKNYEILGYGENKWKEAAAKLEQARCGRMGRISELGSELRQEEFNTGSNPG